MYAVLVERLGGSPESWWRVLPARISTFCLLELRRIRHDQAELVTRAIQPALWLLIERRRSPRSGP